MSQSRYCKAKLLGQIKIGRLRPQTPSAVSSPNALSRPGATAFKAGIWSSFAGSERQPHAGYHLGKPQARRRITLAKVSILED